MEATVDGVKGGEIIKLEDTTNPRNISVNVAAKNDIEKIEIVRNGEVIHTEKPNDWKLEFTFTDNDDLKDIAMSSKHYNSFAYYYVRVNTEANGQAWSSPVWMDMG